MAMYSAERASKAELNGPSSATNGRVLGNHRGAAIIGLQVGNDPCVWRRFLLCGAGVTVMVDSYFVR